MKLIFLGSGSAFTVGANNYQSNMILENDEGQRLLIDCGSDIRWSMHECGLSYRDIHSVFISHLHADHTGGLEWLAFNTYFDPACSKPFLYIAGHYVNTLWNNILLGSLDSLNNETPSLSAFFEVIPVEEQGFFTWTSLRFQLVKTAHVASKFSCMPSYGLYFTVNGLRIYITTDTQFFPDQMMPFYQQADLIFHDCETAEAHSGVHAHYKELLTLDESIKKKVWLYHYNPHLCQMQKKMGLEVL